MRSLQLAVLCGLAVAACNATDSTSPVARQSTQVNDVVPLSATIPSPCNGETVAMSGFAHIRQSTTTLDDGTVRNTIHANLNLQGTGATTGAKYTYNGAENLLQLAGTYPDFTDKINEEVHMIASGKTPNFTLRTVGTIAHDAAGFHFDLKVDETICR